MFVATMNYPVIPRHMDAFIRLWKSKVLDLALEQPGFIRMRLLTREGEVLAIGTWTNKARAEDFMKLGPFKNLMAEVEGFLRDTPNPRIWEETFNLSV